MIPEHAPHSFRDDPSVPSFDIPEVFTVMDAHCALCARGARWIAHNDRRNEFRIIPMQGPLGAALLRHYGMDPDDPTSWLYVERGHAYASLDAVIRVGARLGGRWHALLALRIMPRAMRNWLYGLVARNRYRIWGHADLCALPDPDVRARLLQ